LITQPLHLFKHLAEFQSKRLWSDADLCGKCDEESSSFVKPKKARLIYNCVMDQTFRHSKHILSLASGTMTSKCIVLSISQLHCKLIIKPYLHASHWIFQWFAAMSIFLIEANF